MEVFVPGDDQGQVGPNFNHATRHLLRLEGEPLPLLVEGIDASRER